MNRLSKYLVFDEICIPDRRLLLASLVDLAYAEVEESEALPPYGYRGDRRPETAEIVVRRTHHGSASNDLGLDRPPAGHVPIVSE